MNRTKEDKILHRAFHSFMSQEFLKRCLVGFLLATLIGALIGFGNWVYSAKFKAEASIQNRYQPNLNPLLNSQGLDIASWKLIQNGLPGLASKILLQGNYLVEQKKLYETMSNSGWWSQNVVPSYLFSAPEMRALSADGADSIKLKNWPTRWLVSAEGSTNEMAADIALGAAKFIISGGQYLQIRSLILSTKSFSANEILEIKTKISREESELAYMRQQAKTLEELNRRYPTSSGAALQLIEPKDSSVKFLSITSQRIALDRDINTSNMNLQRYRDALNRIATIEKFLDKSLAEMEITFNGRDLNAKLMEILSGIRETNSAMNPYQFDGLNEIELQLVKINTIFTQALTLDSAVNSFKPSPFPYVIKGVVSIYFLSLLLLLMNKAREYYKSDK